jgi:hypothetical protein
MEIQQDFKELLELFNMNNVEYLIVGGYALAFHGAPRYTGDMDLFIRPDKENSTKILKALGEFGFASTRAPPWRHTIPYTWDAWMESSMPWTA